MAACQRTERRERGAFEHVRDLLALLVDPFRLFLRVECLARR